MMSMSREQVVKVAELARLHLTDDEVEEMRRHLGAVLEYFEQLNAIETTDVEPMAHVLPLQNVFREDAREPCLTPDEALANAPKRIGDYFAVPPILD
jgi:aspartyl-tRNA(Asn)/glutamyl-tRNA(Gln) amidotransferase subunit C